MVTILLATLNGEDYLKAQLESIAAQTYENWQLVVGDDGSTDGTISILEEFSKQYPEQVTIIKNDPPQGSAKDNFISLIQNSYGPYFMFCDQDDVWLDKKIELTCDKMLTIENKADVPCLVYTELRVVDSELNTIADTMSEYQSLDCHKRTINQFILQNSVTGCTMMVNMALRDKMLHITDIDNTIMHDWWGSTCSRTVWKNSIHR